jgi:hypothetical protein
MSNQKLTYQEKNGISSDSIISEFEERKAINREKILSFSNLEEHSDGRHKCLVTKENKEITGSFCKYCYSYIKGENPWKSGVYIFPICKTCLESVVTIEDYLVNKGENKMKSRKTMVDPSSISVDWDHFEKLVNNKQAKLTLLAKVNKIYPQEMKEIIESKYGEKIVFKKGRYGGIFWNNSENVND